MPIKLLVIDDDPNMLELAQYHLQAQGYEVFTAETGEAGLKQAEREKFEVVLTDLNLPDVDGIELVRRFKELLPESEILVITGYSSVTKAVEATKAGAYYFLEKPVEFQELLLLIDKALERRQQAEEIKQLRGRLSTRSSYASIIGSSKAMQDIYEMIEGVAESEANILVIGESGTGKELIANAVHYKSLRAKKPLVKINCSALPKELIESELFGHTKGAFTGAATDKQGLLGQAEGGSLMLDEIGEMPVELQPKLLRVLQERVYYRLGSERAQTANFRLISATNRDPMEAVRDGQLREDLYYRINTIEIHLPPLRQRAEDIPTLADHFLHIYAEKYNRPLPKISQEAYERMFAYHWPGNVRELQNVIERAVLLSKGEILEVASFPFAAAAANSISLAQAQSASGAKSAETVIHTPTPTAANSSAPMPQEPLTPGAQSFEQIGQVIVNQIPEPAPGTASEDVFKQLELAVVKAALERTKGNKQATAALLGLYRPRLYSMIKRHHLEE
ncbi:MAG: sigma-54-dependent Fis family transcriptional regulator [Acidobacteria bacterium]|nr:sigma-54-dependent Fis family transcriptional regulator [Acidobacteriota bacterium]